MKGRALWVVAAITLLGAATRAYDLGAKSFWSDELISLCHAGSIHDVRTFLTPFCGNAHPPLYFLILKGWLAFGSGEAFLRSLSVIFAVAVIPASYLLARELAGRAAAIIASFLVAVSPFLLQYDREVRMYSLLTLLVVLSLYWLLRALRTGA